MTRYRVVHRTEYRYASPVTSSYGQACLLPRDLHGQRCIDAALVIEPTPSDQRERTDFFGNRVAYFTVTDAHDVLAITSTSTVDVTAERGALPLGSDEPWEQVRDRCRTLGGAAGIDARHHLLDSAGAPTTTVARSYAEASFLPGRPVLDAVADLTSRIHTDFAFDPGATDVTSTIDDLFEARAGVCQDFAHLAVSCLRAVGLPGRYVSGYLETVPPPGRERLQGADVSHAWASVLVPDVGWVDLDPTNDTFVDDRYVTVAWGRDYRDVTPVKGVVYTSGGRTQLTVSVDVARV